jgi:tetratricopeptide (TPR) repeat protein
MRAVLKKLSREQLRIRRINPPFESRAEILTDEDTNPTLLTLMAGEFRRGLQLFQAQATDGEQQGRIAWAMTGWAGVAVCHVAMGDFTLAQAAYDRAESLYARSTRSAFPSIALIGVRFQMLIAVDSGWDAFFEDPQFIATFRKPVLENRWSHALVRAVYAFVLARLGQTDPSLEQLASLNPALELGAHWDLSYGPMVCDAAAALWMLNRSANCELLERILREKVIAPDFRFPMRDARLSLARLCALQGRYDEACEWFTQARAVLEEQGARPLRAIADYDQALMFLRNAGDAVSARSFLDSALEQFRKLGMTGRIEQAEAMAQRFVKVAGISATSSLISRSCSRCRRKEVEYRFVVHEKFLGKI